MSYIYCRVVSCFAFAFIFPQSFGHCEILKKETKINCEALYTCTEALYTVLALWKYLKLSLS